MAIAGPERRRRKLKVDLSGLADAFANHTDGAQYFFDRETGAVVLVLDEMRELLENIYEQLNDEGDREFRHFAAKLAASDLPELQKEEVRRADEVERGNGTRFLSVPEVDSFEGHEDMEDYIETLKDPHVRSLLMETIHGRRPFRGFRDALLNYPEARDGWFKFQNERMERRAREWLADQGIEPI